MFADPHRRYNPLTAEWNVVLPHRSQRPWQGQQEEITPQARSSHVTHFKNTECFSDQV
ncbi:MAG: hypothetical protein JSV31_31355 [Desulfobacterales bacterium]|nr:MAG: hypothetical protein JSV31_31355 [Desulfobacterales bacterium]